MKLIILDRDGVINEDSDQFIKSPGEWIPIAGSLESIARLNYFGFKVMVASNQSGIARGLLTLDDLNAIHQKMRLQLDRVGGQIEGVFFCPHGPDENCQCRKPKTGLLDEIKIRTGTELKDVPIVGDSLRDLQSALAVGAEPILVETGKGLKTAENLPQNLKNVHRFPDLSAATEYIIASELEKTRQ